MSPIVLLAVLLILVRQDLSQTSDETFCRRLACQDLGWPYNVQIEDLDFELLAACLSQCFKELLLGHFSGPGGHLMSMALISQHISHAEEEWETNERNAGKAAKKIIRTTRLAHRAMFKPALYRYCRRRRQL